MNGHVRDLRNFERLQNLAEQIPQAVRADALAQCVTDNPHDFERNLTAYVWAKAWTLREEQERQAAESEDVIREFGNHENCEHEGRVYAVPAGIHCPDCRATIPPRNSLEARFVSNVNPKYLYRVNWNGW